MAGRDPYEVLGVPRSASEAEIKKAYRRLARKNHPDVNPGDASAQKRFQDIASAYELLKDPKRRAHFDRTGDTGEPPPAGPGPGGPWTASYSGSGPASGHFRWSGDFGDLFSEIFSGMGGAADGGPDEDDDAAAAVSIRFRDAVLGGTVDLRVKIPRRCARCGGTGRSGRAVCPACRGARFVVETEALSVRIPAGVSDGSKIRVPGKGRSERGDLYLSVTVEPHPYFRREGDDIHGDVPVTLPEAYLGSEIDVPTIRGPVRARIPAGTISGQRFRLKGRGVENARTGTAGDHYYRVFVAVPTRRGREAEEAVETLGPLYDGDPRRDLPRSA